LIDLVTALDTAERITECTGWTVSHSGDDLVHPGTVWIDKRFLAHMKDRRQIVRAKAGMCADPAIVENRDLLTNVRVASVRHAIGFLLAGETVASMGSIAERLDGRTAATTEGHLRACRDALSPRVLKVFGIGHQIRTVERGLDGASQADLHSFQLG